MKSLVQTLKTASQTAASKILRDKTYQVNRHTVKSVVESQLDSEQVETSYVCTECGETQPRKNPIIFSYDCNGTERAGGHITRPILFQFDSEYGNVVKSAWLHLLHTV